MGLGPGVGTAPSGTVDPGRREPGAAKLPRGLRLRSARGSGGLVTTENVAVLFTDMVGSTALASSLVPDAADELRRSHFSILRQAVAETGGAEVKNLGDGLMVVFASTSAALSCAVAMQQGIERDNRKHEHSVGLRIGMSGGEVTREDDDYFGDPVIEAARLVATCEGGQILAADVVRAMAGRRSQHECSRVGALVLKGLPDPVETVEVRWEPLGGPATDAVPLPARLGVRPRAGVVGREADTATIVDAFRRVAGGNGREVLLISGEAGLGKTTLVAEAARTAFDAGACVLFGHCEEDLATPGAIAGPVGRQSGSSRAHRRPRPPAPRSAVGRIQLPLRRRHRRGGPLPRDRRIAGRPARPARLDLAEHGRADRVQPGRRGHRSFRTVVHRGAPDRYRRQSARRRGLLRHTRRDVALAARHHGRAGPAPRADGRRQSRAPEPRRDAGRGPCRSGSHRRRASPARSVRGRRDRPSSESNLASGQRRVRRGRR